MSELPQGWVLVPLGTLIELNPKTIAVEDCTEVGFVPMTLLGKRWFDVPGFELRQWASVKKGYTHFQNGDVLLAKITPCFENGKAGLIRGLPNGIGSGSTEYFVCRTSAGTLDSRYLLAYLKTDDFVHTGAMSMTGSVGHKRVPKEYLLGREIPLAPQREQTRIANQLDTLLTRVQACNDRFAAIPALLKRFRQTVLGAATNGGLTAEWRTDPLANEWIACTVGQVLNGKPRNGYSPQAVDYETSIRSLTLSATTTGKFLGRHSKFIAEPIAVDSHLWLEPGDILIQRANSLEYVGISAIFDGLEKQFIYPDLMMKCRPNERVKNKYLFYALSAESTRSYFRENATGTAGNMPKINQQTVMSAPLLLPPLDEQVEIVRRVEALFALADRVEARCTAARTQAQRLTPLVLAKAFRGELVPQDPNDEPASALLARIGLAKAAAAKPEKKTPIARKQAARKTVI